MMLNKIVVISIGMALIAAVSVSSKDTFSPISDAAFSDIRCVPYAYGDFNADKRIDILCTSQSGKQIEIWLAQEREPLFVQDRIVKLNNDGLVVNIVPGDFNGDSIMDIFVVYTLMNNFNSYEMSLFLGNKSSRYMNALENEIPLGLEIVDQPFAADFNGDGKIDIMIQKVGSSSTIEFYTFSLDGGISKMSQVYPTKDQIYVGYSHSIADMNDDFVADLIVTVKKNNAIRYQLLEVDQSTSQYKIFDEYATPNDNFFYGQSLFADFDSDGSLEHLLPACKDANCLKSAIFVRKNSNWFELPIAFGDYGFIPKDQSAEFWGPNIISLKAGDYNLNGFVDLMAVVKYLNNSTNEKYAILLKNVAVDHPTSNTSLSFGRNFKIDKQIMSLLSHSNVIQSSFFDLFDDGYLDILLALKEDPPQGSTEPSYKLIALKNEYYDDVYFMKVMVIPGICNVARCPFQSLPYGLNYPGAMVKIETTSYEYQRVISYASQLFQSSYMALQMPYTIFGLGATPNFVEHLSVGIIAQAPGDLAIKPYRKDWPQIIPNSQLVISPNPRYYPYSWKMLLFITPSKNIFMTGLALGVTMICLVILIGALQYREKKMDEKERKLESQRFHFDGL